MTTNNQILKRLEALEKEIATAHTPQFVLCYTQSLADRIAPTLPHGYITVTMQWADEAEAEAELMAHPTEGPRLRALLEGQVL